MDENELLSKEIRNMNVFIFLLFLLLVLSPPLIILSLEPEYYFLNTPSFIFVAIISVSMLLSYIWWDSHPIINVWVSTEKFRDVQMRGVSYIFAFSLISIFEIFLLNYLILDYNMLASELGPAYIFTTMVIASGYPIMAYTRKVGIKRYGKSRTVKVNMKNKLAEKLVKEALDSLHLEYKEYPGNRLKSKVWRLELNNDAEIRIYSNGRISSIQINNISDDWEEEEKKIEKEILRMIELERA